MFLSCIEIPGRSCIDTKLYGNCDTGSLYFLYSTSVKPIDMTKNSSKPNELTYIKPVSLRIRYTHTYSVAQWLTVEDVKLTSAA